MDGQNETTGMTRAPRAPTLFSPIGVTARRTGLTARAIRYYEEHALITLARDRRGVRLFDQAALARLEFIGHARRAGLSVEQVSGLLALGDRAGMAERAAQTAQLLRERLAELDRQRGAVERGLAALRLGPAAQRRAS